MAYKTLHRKLKIVQHESLLIRGWMAYHCN